jgi:hypothetical protein
MQISWHGPHVFYTFICYILKKKEKRKPIAIKNHVGKNGKTLDT